MPGVPIQFGRCWRRDLLSGVEAGSHSNKRLGPRVAQRGCCRRGRSRVLSSPPREDSESGAGIPQTKVLHEALPVNGNQARTRQAACAGFAFLPSLLRAGEVCDEHLGPRAIAAGSEVDQMAPLTGSPDPSLSKFLFKCPKVVVFNLQIQVQRAEVFWRQPWNTKACCSMSQHLIKLGQTVAVSGGAGPAGTVSVLCSSGQHRPMTYIGGRAKESCRLSE